MKETIYISRNKSEIELKKVIKLLRNTAWASERKEEEIAHSMENSFCYGIFDNSKQLIGFARIITDFATTFYLMDVIVEEAYRGHGLGKMLMDEIMKDVGHLYGILHTDSAQEFYEKYGFVVTATSGSGESIMEKAREEVWSKEQSY